MFSTYGAQCRSLIYRPGRNKPKVPWFNTIYFSENSKTTDLFKTFFLVVNDWVRHSTIS